MQEYAKWHISVGGMASEMTFQDYAILNGPWDASSIMELHKGENFDYADIQQYILDANTAYAKKIIGGR